MDLNDWYSRYTGNKGTDNSGIRPVFAMRKNSFMGKAGATPMAMAVAQSSQPVDAELDVAK